MPGLDVVKFIAIGFLAGVLSGVLGIGGAVFVVPILVYAFGWSQHLAQGTTLAMLVPPIGILAAWQYYRAGHVNLTVAMILCAGFFVGGYFGGVLATQWSDETLRKIFGSAMLLIALKMIFGK